MEGWSTNIFIIAVTKDNIQIEALFVNKRFWSIKLAFIIIINFNSMKFKFTLNEFTL